MNREISFSKYHGIGNDFILIADLDNRLTLSPDDVARLCDRRFGIGADGVIRVAPPTDEEHFFMDYSNSDGSVGEMCGNGIRCLVVFAHDEGLTRDIKVEVGTRAGRKTLEVLYDGRVRVDMGPPAFRPARIPVDWQGDDALHAKIELDGEMLEVSCVSMGNPHAVVLVSDPGAVALRELGPRVENHPAFPQKTNVEFISVPSPERVSMRVWERGSGETLACGTGACAAAVVARLVEGADEKVTVELPGGTLEVEWAGTIDRSEPVYLTGPAVKAFEGVVDLDTLTVRPA